MGGVREPHSSLGPATRESCTRIGLVGSHSAIIIPSSSGQYSDAAAISHMEEGSMPAAAQPSTVVLARPPLLAPNCDGCGDAVGAVAAIMRSSLNGEAFSRLSAEPCVWAAKRAICCRSVSLEGSKSSLASVFSVQKGIFLRSDNGQSVVPNNNCGPRVTTTAALASPGGDMMGMINFGCHRPVPDSTVQMQVPLAPGGGGGRHLLCGGGGWRR